MLEGDVGVAGVIGGEVGQGGGDGAGLGRVDAGLDGEVDQRLRVLEGDGGVDLLVI